MEKHTDANGDELFKENDGWFWIDLDEVKVGHSRRGRKLNRMLTIASG